jgi:hypothetical protein
MVEVDLDVIGGLPYSRRIRITDGVNTWPTLDDFEVRSEVRVSRSSSSTLRATLGIFITSSIDGNDIVLDLQMTGSDTRSLLGGYYDIVVSDKGDVDLRGIRVLTGQLRVDQLITGG